MPSPSQRAVQCSSSPSSDGLSGGPAGICRGYPAPSEAPSPYRDRMLRLHDTATGEVRPLDLREPGRVSMYVCGFTADNVPHLGHGRFTLVYDVLRRYLEWRGVEVHHLSNI